LLRLRRMNDRMMDVLSVLSIILQLQVMEEQKNQSDNDDIMHELQTQDEIYLKRIMDNQALILEKLNKLTEKVDN